MVYNFLYKFFILDCAPGEMVCDTTRCISLERRCDGNPDCDDEQDEYGCTSLSKFNFAS